MTFKELELTLSSYGVQDPREEAYLLLSRFFKISRSDTILQRDRDYSSDELLHALERRRAHEPLQYILGTWEFMGKEFIVSRDCLIPRPDTEILAEKAIEITKKGEHVADFCTGSGCIGISLACYLDDISLTLVDISAGALDIARKNAQAHGIAAEFILGDITKDLPRRKFDVITSNPPYIPSADVSELSPEVKNEPHIALDGGSDGLDIIRFLLSDGLDYLNEGGRMLIEFGYDQHEKMLGLLEGNEKISRFEILFDYGKNPRCAVIYK